MRKALSIVLALAMIMSLSITALASETGVSVGDYGTDVTGTYVEGTTSSGTVFSVDITWTGMSFTYYAEKAPVWNANDHTYSAAEPARWEGSGTITVTNHSNARISATPAYSAVTGYEAAKMTFSTASLKVSSAELAAEQSGTITVTPSGSLPANTKDTKIGTITVTIAQDDDATLEELEILFTKYQNSVSVWRANGATDNEMDAVNTAFGNYSNIKRNIENGTQPTQDEINFAYREMINSYNQMETKYGS